MSRIRANTIVNGAGTGAPNFPRGAIISGISTINAEISVGTGTSISSPATNELALGTNGTEKVRITSAGRVGIGTDDPGTTLDARGNVQFGDGGGFDMNILGTRHQFSINGSEKVRITSGGEVQIANGNLKFSTAGTGIDFSATGDSSGTMTSELLDDYEEGSWVPTVTGLTNGNVMTLNAAIETMRYIKVGRKVTLFGRIQISSKNSATGSIQLGSFPFTSDNTGTDQSNFNALQLVLHGFSLPSNAVGVVFAEFQGNQTSANVYCVRNNDSWTNLDSGNVNTSVGAYIYITGSYYANS